MPKMKDHPDGAPAIRRGVFIGTPTDGSYLHPNFLRHYNQEELCTFQQWIDVITKAVSSNGWSRAYAIPNTGKFESVSYSSCSCSVPAYQLPGMLDLLYGLTEVMDRIMTDKKYHQECRDCLGNPKTATGMVSCGY